MPMPSISNLPKKKILILAGILLFLIVVLISAYFISYKSQDIRSKAFSPNGISTKLKGTAGNIILKESGEKEGYYYQLYENTQYPCGKSGNHEFLVLQKGKETNKRNLLVRFHGGAVGFFKSDGSYFPQESLKSTLYAERERNVLFNTALADGLSKLFREKDNWRILVPSYCSHDFYIGKGQFSEIDGFSRWGYYAAKEAIDFVQKKFLTDKIVTTGTSAGSSGAFYHGIKRENVVGIVMDSASQDLSSMLTNCQNGISTCCGKDIDICNCFDIGKNCAEIFAERVGFELGKYEPYILIKTERVKTPIYYIWNKNDQYFGMENAKYWYERTHETINTFNPGGKSVAKQVCVTRPDSPFPCAVHSPTKYDLEETNAVYNWIISLTEEISPLPGEINSFEECAQNGFPISLSYPRKCRTSNGRVFIEE